MSEAAPDVAEAAARWDRAIKERDVAAAGHILHEEYALVLVQPAKPVMPRVNG